jgi:hypothetical protein
MRTDLDHEASRLKHANGWTWAEAYAMALLAALLGAAGYVVAVDDELKAQRLAE